MSDVHDKKTRRRNMKSIRNKDTKPEMIVRRFLFNNGFRYRVHYKELPGKPDIVLIGKRVVIEVKGCFWHRHEGCKKTTTPATNRDFYIAKFSATIERDKKNRKFCIDNGWKVIDVWECELETANKRKNRLTKLIEEINQ